MSAPTPAPGDDRPREGYYPDPSIPGYVRYWNGASWVPGTSRPAPKDGEPLAPPPGARPSVEETGPHFFDEDPVEETPPAAAAQHGSRPEPAASWAADRSGAAGAQGSSVAWPGPAQATDPRLAHAQDAAPAAGPAGGAGPDAGAGRPGAGSGAGSASTSGSGPGSGPDAGGAARDGQASDRGEAEAEAGNTFVFRRPTAGPGARGAQPSDGAAGDQGTMTFRAVSPRAGTTGGPGFAAGKAAAARAAAAPTAPSGPQRTAGPAVPHQAAAPAPQQAAPAPQQPAASPPQPAASAPVAAGPGGGQTSWAQQVHRLAGGGNEGEQPVAPWKPPVEDVFQAAARRQAAARPAGLGKRLAARLIDTVVLGAVTAVAAVPLGIKALDHVNGKIDEAKLSGETVTVWLLDGTTSTYLGVVLAVLLLFGGLYEALPTAKWGRTLGKKLLGLEVRDIEAHEPPSLGAALRRWLVYSVPGLLAVGLVGVVWCLFDRPWHQCWHDKAANTFVAG
ncbi:RDD family protein [Streptomyces sp. NPDC057381]|uniref:RDD family protein n=1 Tax=Streptomyces sp. NPDC057381 TaxID=3346111 RepID=UPI0036379D4E